MTLGTEVNQIKSFLRLGEQNLRPRALNKKFRERYQAERLWWSNSEETLAAMGVIEVDSVVSGFSLRGGVKKHYYGLVDHQGNVGNNIKESLRTLEADLHREEMTLSDLTRVLLVTRSEGTTDQRLVRISGSAALRVVPIPALSRLG